MTKIIYQVLLGLLFASVALSYGANIKGAPSLTYVYSNSMEPLIKTNDAFVILPSQNYQQGDIIMYRPVVLNERYITHRIIAWHERGYITKGDNSPYQDQDSGEPEVVLDRIVGKVLTINGQPLVFPGLGGISAKLQSSLGKYSRYLSAVFLWLAIFSALYVNRKNMRRPKPRHRLRLRHLYRMLVLCGGVLVFMSVYLGSRVEQVRYLVSEYPGTLGDQVEVNQPGKLTMSVNNNGLVPVWPVFTAITPLSIYDAPKFIAARSQHKIIIEVVPQQAVGVYQGYIQIYKYPILLPRVWVVYLHRLHPVLAMSAIGIVFSGYLKLLFRVLSHIQGFDDWIPLRAIKDKILKRRLKRIKAKVLGRRRVR